MILYCKRQSERAAISTHYIFCKERRYRRSERVPTYQIQNKIFSIKWEKCHKGRKLNFLYKKINTNFGINHCYQVHSIV